jgi:transposase-like protein
MSMRKRHGPEFKAQVVQELLKEQKTVSQLAAEYGVHPNQLYRWREIAVAGLPSLFSARTIEEQAAKDAAHAQEVHELYAQIGELSAQLAWLKKKSGRTAGPGGPHGPR